VVSRHSQRCASQEQGIFGSWWWCFMMWNGAWACSACRKSVWNVSIVWNCRPVHMPNAGRSEAVNSVCLKQQPLSFRSCKTLNNILSLWNSDQGFPQTLRHLRKSASSKVWIKEYIYWFIQWEGKWVETERSPWTSHYRRISTCVASESRAVRPSLISWRPTSKKEFWRSHAFKLAESTWLHIFTRLPLLCDFGSLVVCVNLFRT
jgi:hypothetical protein